MGIFDRLQEPQNKCMLFCVTLKAELTFFKTFLRALTKFYISFHIIFCIFRHSWYYCFTTLKEVADE
jgi:hypothetical protein